MKRWAVYVSFREQLVIFPCFTERGANRKAERMLSAHFSFTIKVGRF